MDKLILVYGKDAERVKLLESKGYQVVHATTAEQIVNAVSQADNELYLLNFSGTTLKNSVIKKLSLKVMEVSSKLTPVGLLEKVKQLIEA